MVRYRRREKRLLDLDKCLLIFRFGIANIWRLESVKGTTPDSSLGI